MEKAKDKLPSLENEIKLTLSFPDDFICTCELMNIPYNKALEQYLKHIKIYNYFFNENEGANVEATSLFKKFDRSHFKKHGLQIAEHRHLHIAPVKEVLRLGAEEKGSNSAEYINVIENWYKSVFKTQ